MPDTNNIKRNTIYDTCHTKIVGWGLAGASVVWQLYFRGIKSVVYDPGENHSTRIAAGLVNPIVFKRLTKSWKADTLLPYAAEFYRKIEKELGVELLSQRPILRIFTSIEEQNNWSALQGDNRFEKYLGEIKDVDIDKVEAPYGAGIVNTIGNLDTNLFLDASKEFLKNKGVEFIPSRFDYHDVNDEDTFIFCEGFEISRNIFFSYLLMKPSHGETLTIKTKEVYFEEIINKNMYVLPLGDGLFKIGATYQWEFAEAETTLSGKNELIQKLKEFANFNYEIIDHQAGIRPTVPDRRPLIGTHPENKNLHIFNGLGTKGVMIAPYFADHFLDYLLDKKELDKEVNIYRYRKHYNV